jgi:F-type H+-transporting ATPase subunit delta
MTEATQHPTVLDIGAQQVGAVYAKALLGAAARAGTVEAMVEELMSVVDDVFARLPRLEATLASPRVPAESKFRMLDKAFGSRMSDLLLRFLKVLCRRGRFDCLRAIQRAVREQYNACLGRVDVQVRSAMPLSPELRSAVAQHLEAMLQAGVNLQEQVDSRLIGGLVVRVGDTVYDASVANRLVQLRNEAFEKTAHTIKEALQRFEVAD